MPGREITVRGVTYESHAACAKALGVSLATVHSAKHKGRLDTLGLGHRPPPPYCQPVKIRGKEYPSVKAAAKALRVKPSTISSALSRGRLERAGLGRGRKHAHEWSGGLEAKPFSIGGITFRSQQEASRAFGRAPTYVSNVLTKGGPRARENLLAAAMSYIAKKEKEARLSRQ